MSETVETVRQRYDDNFYVFTPEHIEPLLAEIAALRAALDHYAEPEHWTTATQDEQYAGTWYAGRGRPMHDIFLTFGDGWEVAADALSAPQGDGKAE